RRTRVTRPPACCLRSPVAMTLCRQGQADRRQEALLYGAQPAGSADQSQASDSQPTQEERYQAEESDQEKPAASALRRLARCAGRARKRCLSNAAADPIFRLRDPDRASA